MVRDRPWVAPAVITLCLVLGGCQGAFGTTDGDRTVTPAPVPTTATPTPAPETAPPNGRALGGAWHGQWSQVDADPSTAAYRDVRPTCDRSPGQVIRLQIGALLADTDRGIETTWRFLAPDAQRRFGSREAYRETFHSRYRPLVDAESVTRKPVQRNGSVAVQSLRADGNGSMTYRWRLERYSTGPNEGCWLTTAITDPSAVGE